MKVSAGVIAAVLLRQADAVSKERPIMKVVRMLQDMKAELEPELEDDKAVHENLTCWCETGGQQKEKAIELSESTIAQLESSMDENVAKMMELKEKRKVTMAEINSDHAGLTEANEMRIKENKAFHGEETDLIEAVMASKQAITVLGKHNPELAQVRAAARALQGFQQLAAKGLDKSSLEALKEFVQASKGAMSFLQIPGMKSYAPQSGQIFGILKQMASDFESSLSDAQKAELKSKTEYEALKAAKEDEIAAGKKAVTQLDSDLADFSEKHAQEAKELEDTKAQLANDQTFLATLKEKCANSEADYEKRVKDRLTEIAAVEDTIKILNDDSAFEAFDKTSNSADQTGSVVGFLQTSVEQSRRTRATSVLRRAASASSAPQLALLATAAQLDSFTKVKAEIDKLVVEYKQQQKDEVDKRDWCKDEFAKNGRDTQKGYDKKDSLQTKIADLTKSIETLTADIGTTETEVADTQEQMKRASENREGENAEYQQTISDQRVTQMILAKALDRMKQVYAFLQGPGAPHTQTSATKTDPGNGPAKFKEYEENAGGGRVLAMLEEVVADSKKSEDDAIASEVDGQTAYENMMKDSNKAITSNTKKITNLSEAAAKAKESLSMAGTDLKTTVAELGNLNDISGDLHKDCDFVIKNFDARQAARAAEIDAMIEAKNILSGMK